MTKEQKERLKIRLKPVAILAILGFLYYIWLRLTDLKIPCIFYTATGYMCPGCGITRMIMAALRFDFKSALYYNFALFFVLPVLGIVFVLESIRYIKDGNAKNTLFSKIATGICCVILLAFGIMRNI